MKSKTSFYNKGIIINNLKRYGFISAIYGVLTFLIINMTLIQKSGVYGDYIFDSENVGRLLPNPWDVIIIFTIPVLLGLLLYRYINEEKALTAMHAYPVSRKSLFLSHLISFEILFMIPIIANALITLVIAGMMGVSVLGLLADLVYNCLFMLISGTAIFNITVMFGMLVGSTILQGCLTYFMMVLPVVLIESIRTLLSWLLLGFPNTINEGMVQYRVSPYYTVGTLVYNIDPWNRFINLIIMLLLMIGAMVAAYVLYQKRALEHHHDLIAFGWAKKVFVIVMTITATVGLAVIVGSIMGDSKVGVYSGVGVGAVIAYGITKMIAEKSLDMMKYYKRWILITAAFLISVIIVDSDIVGYETYIPEADQIIYAYFVEDNHQSYDQIIDVNDQYKGLYNTYVRFEEKENIDRLLQLHSHYISGEAGVNIKRSSIIYVMKDGRKIERVYEKMIHNSYIQEIHESAEYRQEYLKSVTRLKDKADTVTLRLNGTLGKSMLVAEDDLEEFIKAYEKDYMALSYTDEVSNVYSGELYISYAMKVKGTYNNGYYNNYSEYLRIHPSFEHTMAWLEDNDYEEHVPLLEGVMSATITPVDRLENGLFIIYNDDYSDVLIEKSYEPMKDYWLLDSQEEIEVLWQSDWRFKSEGDLAYKVRFTYVNDRYFDVLLNELPEGIELKTR